MLLYRQHNGTIIFYFARIFIKRIRIIRIIILRKIEYFRAIIQPVKHSV